MRTAKNIALGSLEAGTLGLLFGVQLWWALALAIVAVIALEAYLLSDTPARRSRNRDKKAAGRLSPNELRGIAQGLEARHEP